MGKEVVLFRSKTGYTLRYAQWISRALDCELREIQNVKLSDLESYDTLIIGGSVYLGALKGMDFLLKNWTYLVHKKIYILMVGLEEPDTKRVEKIWRRQFTSQQRRQLRYYYVKGGLNYERLGIFDKAIILLFKLLMQTTKTGKGKTQGFIGNLRCPVDFTNRESIEPLIKDIKKGRECM
ncbi:flavodoxin domain-containing protein [[Clostridium] polysaccharolyticum]|uniref:Protoporphyrinogen IX oxidase, menaquinone-dependent (Flavodoxin domain) n=1 Tax=[Clostridium] polysaccharolyticum TaxID=29364 RepID=A0A1I0DE48_9FIRM|nr:flavodoxin domain-containing protein [[Clostridium] polysaccharolyticum]SET30391.1 Protoporphyrinogen IX oxidase, menaquinone-dependent (flavodoxin domain) [[Clostridium] polysaccharolyticum]